MLTKFFFPPNVCTKGYLKVLIFTQKNDNKLEIDKWEIVCAQVIQWNISQHICTFTQGKILQRVTFLKENPKAVP